MGEAEWHLQAAHIRTQQWKLCSLYNYDLIVIQSFRLIYGCITSWFSVGRFYCLTTVSATGHGRILLLFVCKCCWLILQHYTWFSKGHVCLFALWFLPSSISSNTEACIPCLAANDILQYALNLQLFPSLVVNTFSLSKWCCRYCMQNAE